METEGARQRAGRSPKVILFTPGAPQIRSRTSVGGSVTGSLASPVY